MDTLGVDAARLAFASSLYLRFLRCIVEKKIPFVSSEKQKRRAVRLWCVARRAGCMEVVWRGVTWRGVTCAVGRAVLGL